MTPVPSGVAASPTIRKPDSAAPATSKATTAASVSDAPPGSRIEAPRGRLTMWTPDFRRSCSRYSPGSTTTSVPTGARASASEMDPPARTTIVVAAVPGPGASGWTKNLSRTEYSASADTVTSATVSAQTIHRGELSLRRRRRLVLGSDGLADRHRRRRHGRGRRAPRPEVARLFALREPRSFRIDHGDVVLAARVVGGVDQRAYDLVGMTGVVAHDRLNRG